MARTPRIPRTCAVCTRPFKARARDVAKGRGTTCSRPCRHVYVGRLIAAKFHRPEATKAERVRANGLVNARIKSGAMVRPDTCSKCGKPCKPDGAHDDYLKKAEVRWLCRSCHMKEHYQPKAA